MSSARRAAIVIASATMAIAGTTATATATPQSKTGAHCVANLAAHKTTCYDTFREAIAVATSGRVTDAPATPEKAAKDKAFVAELNAPARSRNANVAANAQDSMVGAILYNDWNYGGGTYTLSIPEPCRNDGQWDYGYDELDGFNDRTSSVLPANNCWIALYSDIYYNGTSQEYHGSTPYVGDAMNDQASSVKLL
ncbi:peptidase inhibitor family I36 protein [Streptomyces sp. NPDC056638]|uniref:peptidase inhibitor family I36 protein n=1 Tax=Streptomyces sp. NPDC056638 TaxID=3345887 RepID=UPI0036A27AF0